MIFPPLFWVIVYLLLLLLPSLALGTIAVHLPRQLIVPPISRFLIGFSATPFFIAVWMLVLAALLPGASRWLFLLLPAAVALVVLALYAPRTLHRLLREWQRIRAASKNPWLAYLIYVTFAVLMALVIFKLIPNGQYPFTEHDALVYAIEALQFARSRSISGIPDFRATIDSVMPYHPHTFLYQALLSQSLMATGSDTLGFPYDHAARAVIQALFLYMLLAVVALAKTFRVLGVGSLAIIVLLQVPNIEYLSYASSRDAFRIIPLVLLAIIFVGLSPRRLQRRLHPGSLFFCLIFAGFSLAAHTLNLVMVGSIVLAWLVWVLLGKAPWRNILLVLGAILIGLFISGLHYLKSYMDTGNFMGYGFVYYAYINTPLWQYFVNKYQYVVNASLLQQINLLLDQDQYRLSVQSLFVSLLTIVSYFTLKRKNLAKLLLFICLINFSTLIPMTGLLDFTKIKLSDMLIRNLRYILHWYPFAAVSVAIFSLSFIDNFSVHKKKYFRFTGWFFLSLLFLILVHTSFKTVNESWRVMNSKVYKSEDIWSIKKVLDTLPSDERILTDDNHWAYYLKNRTVTIHTYFGWGITRAKTETEVDANLKKLAIRYVVFREAKIPDFWEHSALFKYLKSPKNSSLIASEKEFRVYKINK